MLTLERLKEKVSYDPETGEFRHLTNEGRARVGEIATTRHNKHGHLRIKIDGKGYLAHRAAWLYMTGEWPARKLDHEDRDGANNRWTNLRLTGHSQNIANSRLRKDNRSGAKGVHFRPSRNKWSVYCGGKYVGQFSTRDSAVLAYAEAARSRWGEFAAPIDIGEPDGEEGNNGAGGAASGRSRAA